MSEKNNTESSLNNYKRYGDPWDQILSLAADAYDMDLPLFMEMLAAGPDLNAHPELAALIDALPDGGDLYQAEEAAAVNANEAEAEKSAEPEPPKPPRRRRLGFQELAALFGQPPEKRMPGPRRGEALPSPEMEKHGDRQLARPDAPVLERR